MRKKDNTDYYINRHSCFLLQYHENSVCDTGPLFIVYDFYRKNGFYKPNFFI